jgi:hypothetical protein
MRSHSGGPSPHGAPPSTQLRSLPQTPRYTWKSPHPPAVAASRPPMPAPRSPGPTPPFYVCLRCPPARTHTSPPSPRLTCTTSRRGLSPRARSLHRPMRPSSAAWFFPLPSVQACTLCRVRVECKDATFRPLEYDVTCMDSISRASCSYPITFNPRTSVTTNCKAVTFFARPRGARSKVSSVTHCESAVPDLPIPVRCAVTREW